MSFIPFPYLFSSLGRILNETRMSTLCMHAKMKLTAASCQFHTLFPLLPLLLLFARAVTSQSCQTIPDDGVYPNCTTANSAFCEGGAGSPIIFRCFYPYGHACPGNCMDNLDEKYRDAACWESGPGVGDAQCAAGCVSVTAKNGSEFFPFGCDGASPSSVTAPISTTTSLASTSTTPLSPASTTTTQSGAVTTSTAKSDATVRRIDTMGVVLGVGCVINLAALFAR